MVLPKIVDIVRLKLVREDGFLAKPKVESPDDARRLFRQLIADEAEREHLAVLCLDTKHLRECGIIDVLRGAVGE